VVLAIRATGVLSIDREWWVDRPSRPIPPGNLSRALARAVREKGPDSGRSRLTILADKDAPASLVIEATRRAPAGTRVALVVGKSASSIMSRHRQVAPRLPDTLELVLGSGLASDHHRLRAFMTDAGLAELRKLIGQCRQIPRAWRKTQPGGGELLIPAVMDAVNECRCRTVNVPGLASLVIFLFGFFDDNGWVPLDRAALERARALGPKASLAELATLLTGR
jgi:hypothetical protein